MPWKNLSQFLFSWKSVKTFYTSSQVIMLSVVIGKLPFILWFWTRNKSFFSSILRFSKLNLLVDVRIRKKRNKAATTTSTTTNNNYLDATKKEENAYSGKLLVPGDHNIKIKETLKKYTPPPPDWIWQNVPLLSHLFVKIDYIGTLVSILLNLKSYAEKVRIKPCIVLEICVAWHCEYSAKDVLCLKSCDLMENTIMQDISV